MSFRVDVLHFTRVVCIHIHINIDTLIRCMSWFKIMTLPTRKYVSSFFICWYLSTYNWQISVYLHLIFLSYKFMNFFILVHIQNYETLTELKMRRVQYPVFVNYGNPFHNIFTIWSKTLDLRSGPRWWFFGKH